jgi:hypothetical protein
VRDGAARANHRFVPPQKPVQNPGRRLDSVLVAHGRCSVDIIMYSRYIIISQIYIWMEFVNINLCGRSPRAEECQTSPMRKTPSMRPTHAVDVRSVIYGGPHSRGSAGKARPPRNDVINEEKRHLWGKCHLSGSPRAAKALRTIASAPEQSASDWRAHVIYASNVIYVLPQAQATASFRAPAHRRFGPGMTAGDWGKRRHQRDW